LLTRPAQIAAAFKITRKPIETTEFEVRLAGGKLEQKK
jgi:hypothetical protein